MLLIEGFQTQQIMQRMLKLQAVSYPPLVYIEEGKTLIVIGLNALVQPPIKQMN